MKKRFYGLLALAAILLIGVFAGLTASAKTLESAKGENVFVYAQNSAGKSVLMKIVTLDELKAISHGQLSGGLTGTDTGRDYDISTTDNYPTTQYCQARGITVPELVDYVKKVTGVKGAGALGFAGGDTLRLMATDSYGNYSRAWTYDELYGVKRYYFEGLYSSGTGWKPGWEIAGDDNSKFGLSLDDYNAQYKAADPFYADKRAVFASGTETVPILATESLSGRTTSATLVASTELGLADYIAANNGVVAGSLSKALEDTWSLRLSLPMSEADLMSAHRTAYDNFKWIYNMRLDMAKAPDIPSQGTVAAPQASFAVSGDKKTLTITVSCPTPGAQLFYSFDGAPQIPYTGPVTMDIGGRDLSASPVSFYMTAVREGWDDAGVVTARYPGMAPNFKELFSGMIGKTLTFEAADSVTPAEWGAWTGAIIGVMLKAPDDTGYITLQAGDYRIDNAAKTITFSAKLFSEPGSYSFRLQALRYATKNVSVAMKKPAPAVTALPDCELGRDIVFTFDDDGFQKGLTVYLVLPDGNRTLISPTYLDRTAAGRVTIKADWFDLSSCPITAPGTYTLEFMNSGYAPDTQEVSITVAAGTGFADVASTAWYADAVKYVRDMGLFGGTGGRKFSPDDAMTRAMLVTVLSRLAKADADALAPPAFSDVPADAWYAKAVSWGVESGVTGGVSAESFAPDAAVTREQLAAFLYRYAQSAGLALAAGSVGLDAFSDAAEVSGWASEAMSWAVGAGIINGSGGRLDPQGAATRAQVAQVMMNFSKAAD
ncbi:S-layer homology domain-containing protein [Sporobacter termitidis DSM 10068]|uniref:S-layer homology domain-containing protein n=1 Tax=Sporobacter termitidis DSM 10068 TaxID=1123282 RepID=A0A1M5XDS9_9FIRM|nr:S-layer homology domain-containing protein [Sporobacter termitidis]SHH97971.1 S-layer homology domain-containing protein [Sporobacter termitidis DSM 10068]